MFLKKIDIYGYKINFSLNGQSGFNTNFGGIFTILIVFIYLALFNLFSKDLYYKINPKVISDRIYLTDSVINNDTFINDTFLFAIDNPNYLKDPNIYKFNEKFLKKFENNTINIDINFITCDKTSYYYLFNKNGLAEKYYCIDNTPLVNEYFTNLYFSKNIQRNYLEFIAEYNQDYLSKLNETYKKQILSQEENIYIFFPQISFSPNNYENPLEIRLDYNLFKLTQNTKYINNLLFAETKLEQNENILFDTKSEFDSLIHISKQMEYLRPRYKLSDELAKIRIALDGLYYNKYTRVYKKVSEVLAQVFGIMQPLIISSSIIIQYFTRYDLDNLLVKTFLCYFTKTQEENDSIIWKKQNFKDFKNLFKNINSYCKQNESSKIIQKISKLDNNYNLKENICNTDSPHKRNNENFLLNSCNENLNILNKKDSINHINVDLSDQNNKIINNAYNRSIYGINPLNSFDNLNRKKQIELKEKKRKSIYIIFLLKIKTIFHIKDL